MSNQKSDIYFKSMNTYIESQINSLVNPNLDAFIEFKINQHTCKFQCQLSNIFVFGYGILNTSEATYEASDWVNFNSLKCQVKYKNETTYTGSILDKIPNGYGVQINNKANTKYEG